MLIAIASLPQNSGYNGANFNFYVEAVDGKWSEYLYQLSSTGSSALIESKINYTEPFDNPKIGPGYVKLRLDLDSINYPTAITAYHFIQQNPSNQMKLGILQAGLLIPPRYYRHINTSREYSHKTRRKAPNSG